MTDLQKQIRDHYRSMATPISTEEIIERADRSSVVGGRSKRRPPLAVAVTAMGAVLLLIGLIPTVNYLVRDLVTTTSVSLTQPPTTEPNRVSTTTSPAEALDISMEAFWDLTGFWTFRSEINPEQQAGLPGATTSRMLPSADGYYWQFEGGGRLTSAGMFNTTIVFGSDDGTMYGIDMSGPPPLWTIASDGPIWGAPVLADVQQNGLTTVFFGSADGRLRSQEDVEGVPPSIKRVFPSNDELPLDPITVAPLVLDGRVFFAAGRELWALDAQSLEPVWATPFDAGSPISVAPIGEDGSVYVGTLEGHIFRVDAATGLSAGLCYPSRGVPISIQPVIADGLIFITVEGGSSIDIRKAEDCELNVSIALSEAPTSPPAVANDVLYVGTGNFLEAWDLSATTVPQVVWRYPDEQALSGVSGFVEWPVLASGGVYFTTADGWLYAVDLNGKELWRYNVGAPSAGLPTPGNGVVLVADANGTLHAIGCENPPNCG